MIEFVLIFLLGFCCAAFLALLVAPAIWRRAVLLTRERIEATVPLTVGELRAEKDRLRAEHAMEVRRIEIELKAVREKAARQEAEIARKQEAIRRLTEDLEQTVGLRIEQQSVDARYQAELDARDEEIARLTHQLDQAEALSHQRKSELDRLNRLHEQSSLDSSDRQIELAARESEISGLETELASLRSRRKEMERRFAEAEAATRTVEAALRVERDRADSLERRNERLLSTISDLEDKMERKEKEVAPPREAAGETPVQVLSSGASHLDERLNKLLNDKAQLQQEIGALSVAPADDQANQAEEAVLRDRIAGLAAEVVHLAATLDGADSPIHELLAEGRASEMATGRSGRPSLAERVRALVEADAGR